MFPCKKPTRSAYARLDLHINGVKNKDSRRTTKVGNLARNRRKSRGKRGHPSSASVHYSQSVERLMRAAVHTKYTYHAAVHVLIPETRYINSKKEHPNKTNIKRETPRKRKRDRGGERDMYAATREKKYDVSIVEICSPSQFDEEEREQKRYAMKMDECRGIAKRKGEGEGASRTSF